MNKTVEETRRELFEAWDSQTFCESDHEQDGEGGYEDNIVNQCWMAFNAALDAVVIELPVAFPEYSSPEPGWDKGYEDGYNYMHNEACTAIESTNLGIKIK